MKPAKFLKSILVAVIMAAFFLCPECPALVFSSTSVRLHKNVKSIRELRDQNVVKQTSDFSCGAAGLATILNYHLHDPIREQEIIMEILRTTSLQKVKERQGFSLLDLKRFAQQRGYKVTGYKMDVDFLREIDKPVLVPIKFKNYRHFVIIKKVVGDRVFVADPAMGNMIMKVTWFKRIWQDGIGMVIEEEGPRNPFKRQLPSALKVREEDLVVVNGKGMSRPLETAAIRTTVYPTEF